MQAIDNRVTRMLGVRYPIIQAPMGWIARAQLASAVSNAGGPGIIGRIDEIKPVAQIIDETIAGFRQTVAGLARYTTRP